MADIGKPMREVTIEPFPETAPVEEPSTTPVTTPPAPVPAAPSVPDKETVPA